MFTTITYIGTLDGVAGMWCGFKPEGAIITEERTVLHAEKGYVLYKGDEKIGTAVWLRDSDVKDNYKEIKDEGSID